MAIESLPTFTKPARQRWESIPARIEADTAAVQALAMPLQAFASQATLAELRVYFCIAQAR